MINGWLGATATIIFGIHGISMSLFLAGYLPYSYTRKYWGYALFVCIVFHAIIGITVNLFETGRRKIDRYARENKGTHIQRLLGVVAIFAIAGHINAYGHFTDEWVYIVHEPTLFGFIKQVALALVAGAHLVIGFPKSMISIGHIRNPQEIRNHKNFAYMLVGVTWFAVIYGASNYFGFV